MVMNIQEEAASLNDEQLGREVGAMALARALDTRKGSRERAFLDEIHQRHPELCRCPARERSHWLHQRVNDPYGTSNRHPFWETVSFEQVGPWRIFKRDAAWYGYETRQNAWTTARPSRDDIIKHAAGPHVDIWA